MQSIKLPSQLHATVLGFLVTGGVAWAVLGSSPIASSAQELTRARRLGSGAICLSAFDGTVSFAINGEWASLLDESSRDGTIPITGRAFGQLAPCGTNGNFPISGSATWDGPNQIVLGFLLHAVDIPEGCGSIEIKIVLDTTTGTGPLSLWNTRNMFENTSLATLEGPCSPFAFLGSNELSPGEPDSMGNVHR